MSADRMQTVQFRQLMRMVRRRLWLRSTIHRLTLGCYLSSAAALVLILLHLWVVPISVLVWSVVVATPVVVGALQAVFYEKPSLSRTVIFADRWFATKELFTTVHYLQAGMPSGTQDDVSTQILAAADIAAARLNTTKATLPRLTADSRLIVALLLIACSAVLMLRANGAANGAAAVYRPVLEHQDQQKHQAANWLTLAAEQQALAVADKPSGEASKSPAAERAESIEDAQRHVNPIQPGDVEPPAPGSAGKLEVLDFRPVGQAGVAVQAPPGERAIQQPSTAGQGSMSGSTPLAQQRASTPTLPDERSARRLIDTAKSSGQRQIAAQAVEQTQPLMDVLAELADHEQVSVLTTQHPTQSSEQSAELAYQLLGPVARNFGRPLQRDAKTVNQLANDSELHSSHLLMRRLTELLQTSVIGQDDLVEALVVGIFAQGHILLEGAPGLGKTHLAKGLARALGQPLSRIQCTPDLLPADVTGSESLNPEGTLAFQPGPIFSNTVLVDEINRATPRTQAAFLEAMQEHQVTYFGVSRALPTPFWLLATQNSIELEGTYPLPEAQLDRFLFKLLVPFPDAESLLRMSELTLDEEPSDHIEPLLTADDVTQILRCTKQVVIAPAVRQAAVALILATQPERGAVSLRYGASPRGLQGLLRAARVRALFEGRAHVALEDLAWSAAPVLRHRVLLTFEAAMAGESVDELIAQMVATSLQSAGGA